MAAINPRVEQIQMFSRLTPYEVVTIEKIETFLTPQLEAIVPEFQTLQPQDVEKIPTQGQIFPRGRSKTG